MSNKHKYLYSLLAVLPLSITSCAHNIHHDISEYILTSPYKDNYRILQLTDIHMGDKDNQDEHYRFLDSVIKDANADMIIVTGDVFTFASQSTAIRFFNFMESQKTPWSVVWGNHDEQVYFSIDWMTGYLNDLTNKGGYCLFKDIQDDDITGNSNFAINLMDGSTIKEQLILMDSNRYCYGEYIGYDYFKQNQIDWYSSLVDHTTSKAGGVVKSLMFYHIPLPEINDAFEQGTDLDGEKRENCCPPKYNSGFFDVIVERQSTNGMFFGHDHINNFNVVYKDVLFSYGLKSDNRVYYDDDMMGGQVITIKEGQLPTVERIVKTYEEAK